MSKEIELIEIDEDESLKQYKMNGKCHRANGPASIWQDGVYGWYLFGEYHRYYGQQDVDGSWWIHGDLVKVGLP